MHGLSPLLASAQPCALRLRSLRARAEEGARPSEAALSLHSSGRKKLALAKQKRVGDCFIYFSFLLYNFVINCLVTCIFRVFGKKYIPIITVSKIKPKKGTIN